MRRSGLPTQSQIRIPLLKELAKRDGVIMVRVEGIELMSVLAHDYFHLTEKQLALRTNSEHRSKWKNTIRQVVRWLKRYGYLTGTRYHTWRVTKEGMQLIANHDWHVSLFKSGVPVQIPEWEKVKLATAKATPG